jgi:DNA gyrase/topoisomerase IV subunit A
VVDKSDEAVLVSAEGTVIRVSIADFPTHGRYAQGVTLMKLPESDILSAVSIVRAKEDEVP